MASLTSAALFNPPVLPVSQLRMISADARVLGDVLPDGRCDLIPWIQQGVNALAKEFLEYTF